MRKPGVYADCASASDVSFDRTGLKCSFPASINQNVSMCVVSGTGQSACSNALRERHEDDDNMFQAKGEAELKKAQLAHDILEFHYTLRFCRERGRSVRRPS